MGFDRGMNAYYLRAKEILEESKVFKVLAKTPSLFLVSQRLYDYQRLYFDKLVERLQNDDILIQYVFSLPLTRKELLEIGKKNIQDALKSLEEWRKYSNHQKIDLRYVKRVNPFSCCIGDKKTTVLLVYPSGERAAITFYNEENPYYMEVFNELFNTAEKNHESVIRRIKNNCILSLSDYEKIYGEKAR
jgi:hypothetical protein